MSNKHRIEIRYGYDFEDATDALFMDASSTCMYEVDCVKVPTEVCVKSPKR